MADEKGQSTDVDFHLAVAEISGGGAHLLADWSIRLRGHTFNFNVEAMASAAVPETIAYISDLQRQLIDSVRTFGAVHGNAGVTLR